MATAHLRVSAGDRRQQILDAATELFARQGFQGTTTRQIAARAGINEAIIFRHFPTKEDLYWAIIEEKCHAGGGVGRLQERLRSGEEDVEAFAALAEKMLRRDTTMSRLLLFSALENHRLSQRFFRNHVAQYYEALADHIRRGIEAGRFREVDPLLAARGFLGMIFYHFMIQELFGGKRYQQFDPAAVSRTLADIFLQGVSPRAEANASRPALRPSKRGKTSTQLETETE